MPELRWYQLESVRSCWDFLCKSHGNPVIMLPTGAGKSLVIAELCRQAVDKFGGRVLCLAHRKELLQQNAGKIRDACPGLDVGMYSAGLDRRDTEHAVVVAGIQSVFRRAEEFGQRHLVLIDECLTGDTPVMCPDGERQISGILPGDLVCHRHGIGTVEAVRISLATKIWEVRFSNGRNVKCTGNHRFRTSCKQWVRADSLEAGIPVLDFKAVSQLRKNVSPEGLHDHREKRESNQDAINAKGSMECSKVLLHSMRETSLESCRNSGGQKENFGSSQGNGIQAEDSRRERLRDTGSGCATDADFGARMETRIPNSNEDQEGERIPDLLQGGHRESGIQDGNRSGWWKSLRGEKEAGCEEGRAAEIVRVESVSYYECTGGIPVYDLQVSGHPSFFAAGILVHNCHLIPHDGEGMYRTFLDSLRSINPHLRMAGLTATPYRLDAGPICRPDGLFQKVCYSAPVRQLIEEGFLCKLTTKPSTTLVDTSGLKLRGGEFVPSEAERLFTGVVDEACQELVAKASDRRSVLVFASGVSHADQVAMALEKLTGERVGVVTGDTWPMLREQTLADFRAQRLRWCVNVDVLTTGFDAPNIDAIAVLRATMSPGLFAQIVGRGFRMSPGKDDALVLDFGGNIKRHGPIDSSDYGVQDKRQRVAGEAPTKCCPNCQTECLIAATECSECGWQFPRERDASHDAKPDESQILSEPETWLVEAVRYATHYKRKAGPDDHPTLRVDYECRKEGTEGNLSSEVISEWVCLQHEGFALKKARRWWLARSVLEPPETIQEAVELCRCGAVAAPRSIVAVKQGRWWRVLSAVLDERPEEWASESLGEDPFAVEEMEVAF